MDIRKFFGGVSCTKVSEKPNSGISKAVDVKPADPSSLKRSKSSPKKSPAKGRTAPGKAAKHKLELTKPAQKAPLKKTDSDDEYFAKLDNRMDTKVKTKENIQNGGKDKKKMAVKESEYSEKSCHDTLVKKDDCLNNNNSLKLKTDSSDLKKRKRGVNLFSDDTSEEETPITKRKSLSTKSAHRAVIYDSDSDEDPLPENLRDKKPSKRGVKRHSTESDPDNSAVPILEAFGKAQPKIKKNCNQPAATSPAAKRPVDVSDFFGVTPIHQTDSRQAWKTEKESVSEAVGSALPAKKLKLDNNAAEAENRSGIRLSEKLATKKKESEETLKIAEDKHRESATVAKTTSRSPKKQSPGKQKPLTTDVRTPTSVKKNLDDNVTGSSEKGQVQRRNSAAFLAFKNREPPKALGSKEIPEGAENCLEGLTFVITGILESIERDEAKSLVEKYGGKVMQNVSKNTKYVVIGRDAGEAKTAKARQLGIKQLDEDGLLDLIQTLPGKKSKYELVAEKETATNKLSRSASKPSARTSSPVPTPSSSSSATPVTRKTDVDAVTQSSQQTQQSPEVTADDGDAFMWVDRYKPTSSKQIIGQQGDKSNAKKLFKWLMSWHKNIGKKPVFGRTSDDGAGYKAALLSGPPGVGKTTTAQVICQEAGFSFVELNASDSRSKRCLKEEVAEALSNHTLIDFFGKSGSQSSGHRHCLVMDEVDGMAGNEDRGGMQELIQLIKHTKIPIICMCNDRNHTKVRSLSNYCFDLRFQRPRIEQIKGAMMSIAYKEGLKIPPAALNDIILAANQDIRQVLHNLSMWTVKDKTLTYEQLKQEANKAQKDLHLGPFDVCRKVFAGGEETSKMTVNDKADLFFHDYSIGPLFVQENYISVTPFSAQGNTLKHLRCLSRAADSIATGDLVDGYVRRGGNWSLLPTQAIFASVIPGDAMRGSIGQMIQFPSWLGKNSTTSKNDRLHQELRMHMRLNISADKRGLGQDYLPALRLVLTSPLINEATDGVSKVVSMLDSYDLLREDFDSVMELTSWPGMKDPMSQIDSKVKAAFTRTYNKEVHLTPYATGAVAKKGQRRGGNANAEDYDLDLGDNASAAEESEHSDNDISTDTMIKTKKTAPKSVKNASAKSASAKEQKNQDSGKGKGKGKASKKSS